MYEELDFEGDFEGPVFEDPDFEEQGPFQKKLVFSGHRLHEATPLARHFLTIWKLSTLSIPSDRSN